MCLPLIFYRQRMSMEEEEIIHAANNVLKVLILFIGFFYDTNHF